MSLYLLDSCILIDCLRGRAGTVAVVREYLASGAVLASCAVTLAEVAGGMRDSERMATLAFLDSLHYLPTSQAAAREAGVWQSAFRSAGKTLTTSDCLVAATAADHSAVLVTDNVRDFPQPGLRVLSPARHGTVDESDR